MLIDVLGVGYRPSKQSLGLTVYSPSNRTVKRLEDLGITLEKGNPNANHGWLPIRSDVDLHTGGCGKCLVYCRNGVGRLTVEGVGCVVLSKGYWTVFDDRIPHAFELYSRSAMLFVISLKEIDKSLIKGENGYLKLTNYDIYTYK